MTVRVNKSSFNIREKLSELGRKFGLKGSELAAAETAQEARDLVSAGRRNLIINGDMRISQRHGFNNPITVANANNYFLDRFIIRDNTGGTFTAKQSSPGTPFHNALQLDVTVADTSIASTEYARIQYQVEGHDATALDWGYAGAKDHLTLSFWVKTNAPGTYNVSIENSSSFYFPLMVKKYVIKNANVWQKVVVTFPPPTGTYTFERGNGVGFKFTWCLASGDSYDDATDGVYRTSGYMMATTAGQRNWMDTVGNNFYLTGVQAEIGKNATEFEHRSYSEELALCQRYYYKHAEGTYQDMGTGHYYQSNLFAFSVHFPVTMRAAPTLDYVTGTNYYGIYSAGVFDQYDAMVITRANTNSAAIDTGSGTSGTQGNGGIATTVNALAYIAFKAEL